MCLIDELEIGGLKKVGDDGRKKCDAEVCVGLSICLYISLYVCVFLYLYVCVSNVDVFKYYRGRRNDKQKMWQPPHLTRRWAFYSLLFYLVVLILLVCVICRHFKSFFYLKYVNLLLINFLTVWLTRKHSKNMHAGWVILTCLIVKYINHPLMSLLNLRSVTLRYSPAQPSIPLRSQPSWTTSIVAAADLSNIYICCHHLRYCTKHQHSITLIFLMFIHLYIL